MSLAYTLVYPKLLFWNLSKINKYRRDDVDFKTKPRDGEER
jgi:hypothetical protein